MDIDSTCFLAQGSNTSQKDVKSCVPRGGLLAELKAKQIAKAIISEESVKQKEQEPLSYEKRKISPRARSCSPRNNFSKFDLYQKNSVHSKQNFSSVSEDETTEESSDWFCIIC